MVRNQVLRARKFSRETLLEKENLGTQEQKLTFNITYYPAFRNIGNILKKTHILLAPDKDHKNVFPDVPIIGFRNGRSIKDHLVRASLPKDKILFGSEPCGKKRCQVCNHISKTDSFISSDSAETFKIQSGPLNCDSEKVIYVLKCKICNKIFCVGTSKTKFRLRFNNYKSAHRNFKKGKHKIPQEIFHKHFSYGNHTGGNLF